MSRRDLTRFRWGWAIFIVALTSVPYFLNWWAAPAGYRYTWILPPYPEDSFGYMAWAQQAARGAWLFKIKYTALPHAPFLFHPLFLLCGWLSAVLSGQIGVVFLFVKTIGVTLFLITFYRYSDYLNLSSSQSVVASILAGLSSGFGAIYVLCGFNWPVPPADLWMPEVSTFWSLLWNPLFPFSLTLMLLSIFWLDRGTQQSRAADFWRAGLAAGLMTLLHPYSAPLLFAFAFILTTVRTKARSLPFLLRFFTASLPSAIYLGALSRLHPILARHGVAGEMKSPTIPSYVLGFGLPLLLLLAGLAILRGQLLKKYWHLVLWYFLAVLLAYFPFWFQRKLVFGSHIPLCLLGGFVIGHALPFWPQRWRKIGWTITGLVFLPLCASTSCYLLFNEFQQVKANRGDAYFVSNEIFQGLKILEERSKPDEIVFATPGTSRLIPAFAGNTVVWGHWAMTVDYQERQAMLANCIGVGSYLPEEERAHLFWDSGIRFIFADGELKQFIESHPFVWGTILKDTEKIFENRAVVIYRHL